MNKTASIRPNLRRPAIPGSALIVSALLFVGGLANAQSLDQIELEELIAPIALYPDDVLGIVLPASTFPLEIVQAARFLDALETDPSLEPDPDWDASVVALLNYPEIVRMMNDDLEWTWSLGEAVLTDETAVLAAAQTFRNRALLAGNLVSDDKQVVSEYDGVVEIVPADPEVVYIPVYEPREVIVRHAVPIYRYYPLGYPVYYYPYRLDYIFPSEYFWGVSSYFSIGWHTHLLHVHHHSHYGHPYYLNDYYSYSPFYYRRTAPITVTINNYTNVWTPNPRRGNRPRTATYEGRNSVVRADRTTTTREVQPGVLTTTRQGSNRTTLQSGTTTTRGANPGQRIGGTRNDTGALATSEAGSGARIGGTRSVRAGTADTSTTVTRGTSARRSPSADTGTQGSGSRGVLMGRIERSAGSTSAEPATGSQPATRSAPVGRVQAAPAARAQTTRSSGAAVRSSGVRGSAVSGGSVGRSNAPSVSRGAPAPSVNRSAPAPSVSRSAPAPSVSRSAPAPSVGRSAPATRSSTSSGPTRGAGRTAR